MAQIWNLVSRIKKAHKIEKLNHKSRVLKYHNFFTANKMYSLTKVTSFFFLSSLNEVSSSSLSSLLFKLHIKNIYKK